MGQLPAEFWQREYDAILALLLPQLEQLAIAGAGVGAERLARAGIVIDSTLAHANAARWARTYTDRLLQQLGSTTRDGVAAVLENWIATPGATRADLEERLLPMLDGSAARAENVGVTEVTRAFTQGEYLVYDSAGVAMPPAVDTPAGRQPFGPPLHVRCRCWTRIVRLRGGDFVVVWTTNRDELVCKRRIDTPFGVVAGCGDMHNRILSAGDYFGKRLSEVGG